MAVGPGKKSFPAEEPTDAIKAIERVGGTIQRAKLNPASWQGPDSRALSREGQPDSGRCL